MRSRAWPGYAAGLWAMLFGLLSVYWAAGGRLGEGTIGAAVEGPALARDPAFVALLWVTAALKIAAGLLGFALTGRMFRWAPRWMLLTAGWGAAALLALYGVANSIQHLLIAMGLIDMPAGLGWAALPWHLLLWDPVWLAGGLFFTLAVLYYRANPSQH